MSAADNLKKLLVDKQRIALLEQQGKTNSAEYLRLKKAEAARASGYEAFMKKQKKSLRGTPAKGLRGLGSHNEQRAELDLRAEAADAIAEAKSAERSANQKMCRAAVIQYGHAREAQGSAKALKAYVASPSKVANRIDDVAIALANARKAFLTNCSCRPAGTSGLKGRKKGR